MAWFFFKKQLILVMFYRPCNLEGVGGYNKKQTELYPYKCWSKGPTSSSSILIVFPTKMTKYLGIV